MKDLKEPIANANKQKDELYKAIKNLDEFISSCQKICEHDWQDAPDLFDYHNRIDYDRCDICGKVR